MSYAQSDAEDYVEAYVRAYTKSKSNIYARTYARAYIDTIIEARALVYGEAYTEAFTIAYKNAYPEAIARANAIIQAIANSEARTETGVKTNPQAMTEAETKIEEKAKIMADAKAWAQAQADPVAKVEAKERAEAAPKAEAEAEVRAESDAAAEVLASLYNLATDCLRLSTYFFHPIQQCAQQVYHTAIPLSPTSTQLHESCLQSVIDNHLSHVATFSGAPDTWGSLLRVIDVRPRQLMCITTSAQRIIAASEEVVNLYDAVTFALRQTLHTPETVLKIEGSPDGSTLFFAHSSSVTMWDMQTGGLIHTFTVQSKVNDIAVSANHVTCGLSDGSVIFWDTHTKEEVGSFGNGQSVVSICQLPPPKFAVVTQNSIYICDLTLGTSESLPIPGHVWGAVYLADKSEFLVGMLWLGEGTEQDRCYLRSIKYDGGNLPRWGLRMPTTLGRLMHLTLVGKEVACITVPSGLRSFNTVSRDWTDSPPLLSAATSVAVSLNRNLVVQAKDSIKIFPVDIITSGNARKDTHRSHIYPLGKNNAICVLHPTRHLALLDLETLQELHPQNGDLPLGPPLAMQLAPVRELLAELGVLTVVGAWQSGSPLPERTEESEGAVLCGLSPKCTQTATVYNSPRRELCVKDVKGGGIILAKVSLEDVDFGTEEVYDVTFDSETRFYLRIDGVGQHIQIPYDIIASPSGGFSHTITKGEPVPLLEPRETPPYTLDGNCEWVLDAKSRKICWISPGDIRRGDGGHFWAGPSLVMVGDDGAVRKLTFKDPEY